MEQSLALGRSHFMADATFQTSAEYAKDLARGFTGALIFAFPLLMTMEMWQLGFYADPWKLALFLALGLPVLFGLSYYAGFRETDCWQDDLIDALAAYALGFVASAALLTMFAVLGPGMGLTELVGKVAVQALPAAIGAMLARSQLSGGSRESQADVPPEERRSSYGSELFLMMVGAVFLAFNVAPTEEMILIAHQMTNMHTIILSLASLLLLHILVFSVGFAGQEEGHGSGSALRTFLHFTLAGYGIALLVSLYILWTFDRTEGASLISLVKTTVVLGFPASLGAAAARLLI